MSISFRDLFEFRDPLLPMLRPPPRDLTSIRPPPRPNAVQPMIVIRSAAKPGNEHRRKASFPLMTNSSLTRVSYCCSNPSERKVRKWKVKGKLIEMENRRNNYKCTMVNGASRSLYLQGAAYSNGEGFVDAPV